MAVNCNENDRHAAAWLRELIEAGLIASNEVDEGLASFHLFRSS